MEFGAKDRMIWHRVAKRAAVRQDEALAVAVGGREVALCDVDGVIHAIDNICTHEYACLSHGFVEHDEIECPLHQARFHIPTGKVLRGPAEARLRGYRVRVEGEDVYVGVTE